MARKESLAVMSSEMAADLHGHTLWSGEGSTNTVRKTIERAAAVGLDIVAITEHSYPLGGLSLRLGIVGREIKQREDRGLASPLVILGEEVSTNEGHILALGFDPSFTSIKGIPSFRSAEETVRIIHDRGLLAIAAHPTEKQSLSSLSYKRVFELARRHEGFWDGIETASSRKGIDSRALDLAGLIRVPGIGGSDFHRLEEIGLAGTCFSRQAAIVSSQTFIDFLKTKPSLKVFSRTEPLPSSRNIFYWLRNLVNNHHGR